MSPVAVRVSRFVCTIAVAVLVAFGTRPAEAQELVPDDQVDDARLTLMRNATTGLIQLPAAITGEGLKTLLNPIMNRLDNSVNKAAGNAHFVLQDLLAQLRQMQFDLDQSLGDNVRVPIQQLTLQTQVLASQLYGTAMRVNDLLSHQQACLADNAELVVSGLRAAVSEAKQGIPLVDAGAPWVASYRFDGLRTANVVPPAGGRLTVSGYKLWAIDRAPQVRLLSADRQQVYATPAVSQGRDANSLSIQLDGALLSPRAGECLALEVVAYDRVRRGPLGLSSRERRTTRMLPLCVPERYARELNFVGHVRYNVDQMFRHELEAKQFPEAVNSSCGQNPLYVQHLQWPVPRGYRISAFRYEWQDWRHDGGRSIQVNITAPNQITASGNMATPRCILGRLSSHSFWRARVVPTIEGTGPVEVGDSASVGPLRFEGHNARTCIRIPKHQPSNSTTFWFSVEDRSQNRLEPFTYTSARQTVVAGFNGPIGQHLGYQIDAVFNPQPVDGTCELCVQLRSSSDCGF
jgi:hypothetical protein